MFLAASHANKNKKEASSFACRVVHVDGLLSFPVSPHRLHWKPTKRTQRKEKKNTLWMDRTKQVQLSLGNVQFEDVVLKEREGKEYRS